MITGQSSHSPSYCCGCNLCTAIFNRRVWSMNSKEWLWGANQSSLLFIFSSTFYTVNLFTFCIVNLSFYRVNFSFNRINFYLLYGQLEFLYGQLLTFYMVTSIFYRVNFLLFIPVSVKANCTYQIAYCRPGVKCRLKITCWLKTIDQG